VAASSRWRPAPVFHDAAMRPAAAPPSGTLRDTDRQLIAQTVRACGGNVSKAARALGISRGRIYRHLKQPA